jgi:hypothetical protein
MRNKFFENKGGILCFAVCVNLLLIGFVYNAWGCCNNPPPSCPPCSSPGCYGCIPCGGTCCPGGCFPGGVICCGSGYCWPGNSCSNGCCVPSGTTSCGIDCGYCYSGTNCCTGGGGYFGGCADPCQCQECKDGHPQSKCDPLKCEECNNVTHACESYCKPKGCDSWDREHCMVGECWPCLRKAGSYTALMACDRVDDPSTEPSTNGCGPGGDDGIPDDPANCSYPDFSSFKAPCDHHDFCYQTCNTPKSTCDSAFGDEMDVTCQGNSPLCYISCEAWRVIYWTAVAIVGENAYETDQLKACACCDCE